MNSDRLYLDTAYVLALLNVQDQFHAQARQLLPRLRQAAQVWITEAVLTEIGNALARDRRDEAAGFIEQCYRTPNLRVVPVETSLFRRALSLYQARPDKTWGLTDCLSFVVMQDQGLADALTADEHFIQAGFRALLRETQEKRL